MALQVFSDLLFFLFNVSKGQGQELEIAVHPSLRKTYSLKFNTLNCADAEGEI